MPPSAASVYILGSGKVGSALHLAFRKAGLSSTLRSARKALPRMLAADVIVLAVRDRDLAPLATRLASEGRVSPNAVCVHVAGALDATPLAPLRAVCRGVAQMHPMISFASKRVHPDLTRGNVHVQGDAVAVKRARALARAIGMTPRSVPKLDAVGYHAAAALIANGAVALAAGAIDLLVASGVARAAAAKMLGPLLRSVADNIEALGFPESLTGPIRRGDASAVERALGIVRQRAPHVAALFVAASDLQIPLARELGDVPERNLQSIRAVLHAHMGAHTLPAVSKERARKARHAP